MFISGVALYLADISVTSKDMLQSLIQAEATLLGFFGIIASYVLVSYDTRLDRLEQQRFDCEMANKPQAIDSYCNKIALIKNSKEGATEVLLYIGVFFILSLLLSIIALGTVDTNLALSKICSYLGLMSFFVGICGLVLLFIAISKEPE